MADDSIHCNVHVWSILLSIVFVIDFLNSAGILGLCIAILDTITFTVIIVITAFCVVGFLPKSVWFVAKRLLHRRRKGSKWRHVLSATGS